jgi:methionyl-tRNA formyltransferase
MLTRQDGKIDFKKETAEEIERKIRAFHPWPGTWAIIGEKRIKILKAQIVKKEPLAIKTKKGFLKLKIVQPEGKKPMSIKEFLAGNVDLLKFFC